MPSINDVLKEKFNVTGNNIAETLSKIEPSGGGSGAGPLLVNLTYEYDRENQVITSLRADKTAAELLAALPYVNFVVNKDLNVGIMRYPGADIGAYWAATDGPIEDPELGTLYFYINLSYLRFGDSVEDMSYTLRAESPDDYPEYEYVNESHH